MNLNVAAKCHRAGRKQGSQQKPLELLLYLPYWPKVIMGGHDDPASEKRERHVTTQGTGENAVVDVIRFILCQIEKHIQEHALMDLSFSVGAHAVSTKIAPITQWGSLSFEPADAKSHEELPTGCRCPGLEPRPAPIDTWARGAIPLKCPVMTWRRTIPQPLREAGEARGASGQAANPDGSSHDASSSMGQDKGSSADIDVFRSSRRRGVGAREATGKAIRRGRVYSDEDPRGAWIAGDISEEMVEQTLLTSHEGLGLSKEGVDIIGREWRNEERLLREALRRQEEKKAKVIATVREREERENAEARQRAERMAKELKGREWVWDADGEIMILDEIDPKKFPGPAMPRFTVRTAAAASTGINANKLIGGDGPSDVAEQGYSGAGIEESRKGDRVEESVEHGCDHGSAVRGKRKTSRDADVRQTRAGDPDRFFELDPMFQPPLQATLALEEGVSVHESAGGRETPRRLDGGSTNERDVLPLASSAGGSSAGIGYTSTPVAATPPSECLPVGGVRRGGGKGGSNPASGRSSSRRGKRRDSKPGLARPLCPPRVVKRSSRLDPLGGGEGRGKVNEAARSPLDTARTAASSRSPVNDNVRTFDPFLGAMRRGARSRDKARSPEASPHHLHAAPECDGSWGGWDEKKGLNELLARAPRRIVAAKLPRKPRTRDRRRVQLKPNLRGPRDRGGRLIVPTVFRKHLPPPPFGETMGHGLKLQRDGDKTKATVWVAPGVPSTVRRSNRHDEGEQHQQHQRIHQRQVPTLSGNDPHESETPQQSQPPCWQTLKPAVNGTAPLLQPEQASPTPRRRSGREHEHETDGHRRLTYVHPREGRILRDRERQRRRRRDQGGGEGLIRSERSPETIQALMRTDENIPAQHPNLRCPHQIEDKTK